MQPIIEITPDDELPDRLPRKPRKIPMLSFSTAPLAVVCWLLSLTFAGVAVGFLSTQLIGGYSSLLLSLLKKDW